ncbi:MAG TPA: EAL domain-containing protein [Dehalococcoidia bacterium]|nr:EAL domain-containing protein [Dehalococcoidia bacterium]
MKLSLSTRTASRLGTLAMALLLIAMVAITIRTLAWSRAEIDQLQSTIRVSDAYNQTALSAALSAIHSNDYAAGGDPADLALYQNALQDTFRYETLAKSLGTDEDRAYLLQLEAEFAAEIVEASQVIAEIASGDFQPENSIEASATMTEVTALLTEPAREKREGTLVDLESFKRDLGTQSLVAIGAFALGLPLVVGSFVMTRRFEHKEAVAEGEMARLKEAALTDGLTGLANHRAFQEDLRREVARAGRNDEAITIAMLDVDDFKEINDSEGHAQGDAVLAELARLMTIMRAQDRAYRVGGDEFALIMPNTGREDAAQALERLRDMVETGLPGVSVSIGYASSSGGFLPETMRDHADMALYEAKHRGKDQVAEFELALAQGVEMTADKMQAVRRVLQSGAVSMWFQPIYKLGSQELLAFEALLRLPNEPDIRGPEEAFEIAQTMGRSRELDLLCVSHALAGAADLPDDIRLFMNLDPGTLSNSRFSPDELLDLVQQAHIKPSRIVFELTEHTIAPIARVREQVEALHARGFGVALDDVGSGNSGLEMMRLIKFDYVKIDRSVILDAMEGGQGRAVIVAIVAFARETGSYMIAEGIENASMLMSVNLDEDGLKDFWVQGVQGFLFGEPGPSIKAFLSHGEAA